MFVIRALFTGNQLVFRLVLYISTLLFFSPLIQADSKKNTVALSLIAKAYLNRTPQLSYKISSTSKGITATPVLKGVPSVSISRDSGINHSIQINGKEHFVTTSPTTGGRGLIVQTQASNGTSAHLLKVYPAGASRDDKRQSYYIKDESSGATFLATTNDTTLNISLQQEDEKTTDDDCDGGYKVQGKCQSLPAYAIPVITVGVVIIVFATVTFSYFCCKCCRNCSGGDSGSASTIISLGSYGGGCE